MPFGPRIVVLDSTARDDQRELVEKSIMEANEAFSCNNIHRDYLGGCPREAPRYISCSAAGGLRDIHVPMPMSVGDQDVPATSAGPLIL